MKDLARPWQLMNRKKLFQLIVGELFLVLLNLLCYSDWVWLLPMQILIYPFISEWDKYTKRYMKKQYDQGFQELLQSLMTSIQVGYTIENACRAALPELEQQGLKKKDLTVKELRKIVYGLDLGIPVDELFINYANNSGSEDILQFAGVMEVVKSTGGNLVMILKRTMYNFQLKMETEEEIRVILSGVIYEKNIMLIMPLLILGYMRVTNHEYMACIYESLSGHILMSLILSGIAGCYYWTESMIRIRL